MVPKEFLLIAGDAAGDRLAAALVTALRSELTTVEAGYGEGLQPLHASLEPRFYGAGGPHIAKAGVELLFKAETLQAAATHRLRHLLAFRRVFGRLYRLALERQPHAVIGVGSFGFNRRLAHALKHYARHRRGTFSNWNPRIIQLGAPSGWPSRSSRAQQAGKDIDLLLSTETTLPDATPASNLHVESVGPLQGTAAIPEIASRAALVIVSFLMESEEHFPLRASLSSR